MSNLEEQFLKWLRYSEKLGYVTDIEYEPETFVVMNRIKVPFQKEMKTKTKTVEKTIIDEIEYTPDFRFILTEKFYNEFPNFKMEQMVIPDVFGRVCVDIKSKYKNTNSSNASFPVKRALLYLKHGIYVTRVTLDSKVNHWYKSSYVTMNIALYKSGKKVLKQFRNYSLK